MNRLILVCLLVSLFVSISVYGSKNSHKTDIWDETCQIDSLSEYRDTLVGRFNGVDIDTLICEPIGKMVNDEIFGEFYNEWRVYTKKGTVEELKIGNTIGIKFIEEMDLDGNKTEEWGFLIQWPTSSWTAYYVFTFEDGKWKLMVDPIRIWYDHLETSFTESDIAQPSEKKGYIRIKSSDVNEEVTDYLVIDAIVPIHPKELLYELIEW